MKEFLGRFHEKVKAFTMILLERVIIPVALIVIYIFGVGMTKLLMLFVRNPLKSRLGAETFWQPVRLGFDPQQPDETPAVTQYERQS
jgi:hypothetical protein